MAVNSLLKVRRLLKRRFPSNSVLHQTDSKETISNLPEDLGKACAKQLCEEIAKGGCVDTAHQSLTLLMMVCPLFVFVLPLLM